MLKAVDVNALAALFRAAADPTRLRILALLGEGDVCVCHIYESLRISQTKASRHLAYLRKAGLVEADKRGLWVHYRLATPRSEAVARMVAALREEVGRAATIATDRARLRRVAGRIGPRDLEPQPAACCTRPAEGEPCCTPPEEPVTT